MNALFAAMLQDGALQRLRDHTQGEPRESLIYGLGGSQKHAAVAACYAALPQMMAILCHSAESLADWKEDLSLLLPEVPVVELPEVDTFDVKAAAKSQERAARRMEVLGRLVRGEHIIVLARTEAAVQKGMGRNEFKRLSLTLRMGEVLPREELLERLVDLGYEHAEEVERVGQFSVRGGIVDIFAINAAVPVRVEYFDDEIDSLREFDLDTKRSTKNVGAATIMPLAQTDASGKPELFLSYLEGKGTVLFDEPTRIRDTIRTMVKENPDIKGKIFSWEELLQAAHGNRIVYMALLLQQVPGADSVENIGVTATTMTPFRRQMDLLENEANRWLAQKQRVLVLLSDKEKANSLREFFAHRRIPSLVENAAEPLRDDAINIRRGSLLTGFEMASARLVVVTEKDIFGRHKRHTAVRKHSDYGEKISHFRDIKPGDYVVHESHGIGKYLGVETLDVGGIHKDYLHIQYAGDDKLFVPTDQVGLLQKYIGSEGDVPRLHRMGGTEWVKAKARAKKSVEDIAQKLIEIYAKRKDAKGHAFPPDDASQREFEDAFPYEETEDQLRAIAEIKADMEKEKPMDRLLCGDVGYGKTEVALRAVMKCVLDGKQAAILVPTTVLAQQHYATALNRFRSFPVRIEVLSRFKTPAQKKQILQDAAAGKIDLLIGTHSLLQKSLHFKDLGLLIIDEEQRFGVTHKEKLKELSRQVDTLTLSATPIPRTLNMALSGIRDMSTIEVPPVDRQPVQTYVLEHNWGVIADAIRRELARGGQVYYMHNRVETIDRCAATLKKLLGDDVAIGVAHGKMDEKGLSSVMQQLSDGEIQVLVCTTIIETGIDIPNVNTLIIEDADRLGLAQLHQIRGRIGRSARRAYAYMTYRAGKILTEVAAKRLTAIREYAEFGSGFRIAMRDLEIRGAGNLLGPEQSGYMMSVGYDMYLQLLEEAVLEQRGEKAPQRTECSADLTVSANLPESYIPSGEQRMDIYRRIAALRTAEQSQELLDELIDRYGEPPQPVLKLMDVALLRAEAVQIGVSDISQRGSEITFTFAASEAVPVEAVMALCSLPKNRRRLMLSATGTEPKLLLRLSLGEDALDTALTLVGDLRVNKEENEKEVTL